MWFYIPWNFAAYRMACVTPSPLQPHNSPPMIVNRYIEGLTVEFSFAYTHANAISAHHRSKVTTVSRPWWSLVFVTPRVTQFPSDPVPASQPASHSTSNPAWPNHKRVAYFALRRNVHSFNEIKRPCDRWFSPSTGETLRTLRIESNHGRSDFERMFGPYFIEYLMQIPGNAFVKTNGFLLGHLYAK